MERDQSPTRKPEQPKESPIATELLQLLRENNGVLTPEQARPFLSQDSIHKDVQLFQDNKLVLRLKFPGKKGKGLLAPLLLPDSELPQPPYPVPDIRIVLESGTYQTVVQWIHSMRDLDWEKQPLVVRRGTFANNITVVHRSTRWGHLVFSDMERPRVDVYGKFSTEDLVFHLSRGWFPKLHIVCRCADSFSTKGYLSKHRRCNCSREERPVDRPHVSY